MHLHAYVVV